MNNTNEFKKTGKGYWSNHKFTRINMSEVVRDYCGDDVLEQLVENCERLPVNKTGRNTYLKRNKALIATLFLTGGRVNEVLLLKKENFDFDNEEAKMSNAFLVNNMEVLKGKVRGKTVRITRTFPIWNDDPLVDYLKQWWNEIDNWLFPSSTGAALGPGAAFKIVREAGKLLDRPFHVNTIWFRKQRQYYLVKRKKFTAYNILAYFKLKLLPKISSPQEDWQNLLAITRPIREEKIYENAPYDALRDLQKLFKSANKEIKIIDAYVDDTLFELYLKYAKQKTKIKLITKKMQGLFTTVAKKYKIQNQNFEVKQVKDIHDRYLIIDGKVRAIGSSLNFAGIKPLYVIELSEQKKIKDMFERLWKEADKAI